MTNVLAPVLACICWMLPAVALAADDFEIVLKVKAGEREAQTAQAAQSPSKQEPPARRSFTLKRDETAQVSWRALNTSKTKFTDVVLHFFVVQEEKPGQREVPKLTKDVVYEGALTTDFKPKERADWKFDLKIPSPGSYLLRVEAVGAQQSPGYEGHAALDLLVE
jgi:hypothetical protein